MSKRICILSDTHGALRGKVLEYLSDVDCIIHAGDFDNEDILDQLRRKGSIYAVKGNCDKNWAKNLRTRLSFTIEGVKFALVHNKGDLKGLNRGADVIIFGHTHHYYENTDQGQLWLNPGSAGFPRYGSKASFVMMNIEDGQYTIEHIEF